MHSLIIALFTSLGSKHIHSGPSGFHGFVIKETHSVGIVTGVMIFRSSICCNAFSICSLYSIGTFLLAC